MIDLMVRRKLADHVLDVENTPMSCLGAAVTMLRLHGGPAEVAIAKAVDTAIQQTINDLQAKMAR